MSFDYVDWLEGMSYPKDFFFSLLFFAFESIIWNNKIQIYQKCKALTSKVLVAFEAQHHFRSASVDNLSLCWCVSVLGWCWVPPALASHPHGNQHSSGLPALHTGHAKGTLLSSEITTLLRSPEINKRNSSSTGSTHLATVHFTLYLPGEDTDIESFTVCRGRERERGTGWE